MLENGFIKLYRSLLKWEWYDDINTKTVFIHLLLTVNVEDCKWRGVEVKRGSRVASYETLSQELKLSVKQIRTAINHLETTGEVARSPYPKFTVFTIKNYDKFQERASKTASKGQGEGKVRASKGQQSKKDKKDNNDKNLYYISFGEFNHIKLTEEQYQNLIHEFGEETIKNYIRKMDEWIQLKGKKPYKDYNLAIRNWINRDKENNRNQKCDDFDVEKYKQFINKF